MHEPNSKALVLFYGAVIVTVIDSIFDNLTIFDSQNSYCK